MIIDTTAPTRRAEPRLPMDPILSPTSLRKAFAKFPSGVMFLSAVVDGEPLGMVMSSFTSVSLEPPLVSLCVQGASTTWPRLRRAPLFGLSAFADGQERICRLLSGKAPGRFQDAAVMVDDDGRVFLPGAPLRMSCRIEGSMPAGDHDIVLFRVLETAVLDGVRPLIFLDSKLGPRDG